MMNGAVKPLLQTLFDVQLQEQPIEEGEVWNKTGLITKYSVVHGSRVILPNFILYRVILVICT